MNYLYGDSTTSQLKSNFLEFLRDSIDFSVFVLQADARMKQGRIQIRELGEQADAESERLDRFISSVSRAVHGGDKGEPDSPTAKCGDRLAALIVDAHRASIDGIRQNLADAVARIEEEEAASRDACLKALGALLAPHDPPDSTTVIQLSLGATNRYKATLDGKAQPDLAWTLEVGIPDGHAWSSLMRVDRLVPHLEIRAPQLAGWITKEVKIRPQKIERYVITKVVQDDTTLFFEARTEANHDIGFDFDVSIEKTTVMAKRVGAADDASVGSFEPQVEDVPLIVELATKLRDSLGGLERRTNISATFAENDFRTLPTFVDFVQRLVEFMTPIVREISQRSLTPNELVLRRALANDRREEIFVAKATLREKLAVLPSETRALFKSLGLEVTSNAKAAPVEPEGRAPIRSELPPSVPPPKPVVAAPSPPAIPSSKPATPKDASKPAAKQPPVRPAPVSGRTLQPPQGAPPQAPVAAGTQPASPVRAPRPTSDAPQIEVVEEVEVSSETLLESIPESSSNIVAKAEGEPRNEALVAALKKIMRLSKNGRAVEAYQEYEGLFSSSAFADFRPEDQRQALKLMVLAKTHPADKEAVSSAHRAALKRIQALVDALSEPADHELLGVTHLFLGDEKAASSAFQTGLDLERSRNPQSELIATLMRRVSQV
jgi:hypothetical protein